MAAREDDGVVSEPSRPALVMGSVSCALSCWRVCSPSPGFSQGLMSTGLSLWLIENPSCCSRRLGKEGERERDTV